MEGKALLLWCALAADGLAGLAGGLVPERVLLRQMSTLLGFAAGALLGAVFLDLLPDAVAAQGIGAFYWALASFCVLVAGSRVLTHRHTEPAGRRGSSALPDVKVDGGARG